MAGRTVGRSTGETWHRRFATPYIRAVPDASQPRFTRRQKVVAAVDLPGVPAGTDGRIQLVNGLTWIRYWVHFANGVDLGQVDGSQLASRDDWQRRSVAAGKAARAAERDAQRQAILDQAAPTAT